MFNIISKELDVSRNVCEILEKFFEYTNKHRKIIENEYGSQFNDYRDNDEAERTEHINKEHNKQPVHKKIQKLDVNNDVMMDMDGNSLYPSAIWEENSVYPKIESGFVFAPHMNDVYVKAFNDQTFNEDGGESVILRLKPYNPPILILEHFPVKEKVKTIEVNRTRNGYFIDTFTSVDICEFVITGGRVIEIYKGIFYRENFEISPIRKNIEKLFTLTQKLKDEYNDLMQRLVKLIMNRLYGVQIRKDIDQS